MNIKQCDAAVAALIKIEEAMLRLRDNLAVGSMLRGWQLKQPADVSETQVLLEFNEAFTAANDAMLNITTKEI